uniref:Secreted protein n=1 Tax=Angiostrongylus cantonensis TaxID=6313 RepID=A0A0K0DP53_ANGCA
MSGLLSIVQIRDDERLTSRSVRLSFIAVVIILSPRKWYRRVELTMHLLLILLLGSVAATNIIEGSGNDSGLKHSVSSPDMEIHGSGYGSDDEDGDAVHGSGVSVVDVVESSGSPPLVQLRPQVTTTTTTTHIPPVQSYSEFERSHNTTAIMTTPSVTTSTRRVLIMPATTPDPTATQSPFHPVLKPGIFAVDDEIRSLERDFYWTNRYPLFH